MKREFYQFGDCERSWLRVDRKLLAKLGLGQNSFSGESHIDVHYMYLDELQDMNLFLNKYYETYQITPLINQRLSKRKSFVRSKHSNYEVFEHVFL